MDDFFVPVVADEVLDQQKFCTFFLNTCDTDTWRPIDMEEYIANFLLDKPEAAKSNDFVNKLYE